VNWRISGLYAVTPDTEDTPRLLAQVQATLSGGASALQYRNKAASAPLRMRQGALLLELCRRHGVPMIVNDDLALALALDADGAHLGADDGPLPSARQKLGERKILGASCYRRLDAALAAEQAGADYVAFGSFFASTVKPGAVRAPLSLLTEARQRLTVPIVAIGGITLDNAPALIAAGANSVAVITAVFGAADVCSASRGFAALFQSGGS
jgi:thiamine-phosphate pyrophosphorylase